MSRNGNNFAQVPSTTPSEINIKTEGYYEIQMTALIIQSEGYQIRAEVHKISGGTCSLLIYLKHRTKVIFICVFFSPILTGI